MHYRPLPIIPALQQSSVTACWRVSNADRMQVRRDLFSRAKGFRFNHRPGIYEIRRAADGIYDPERPLIWPHLPNIYSFSRTLHANARWGCRSYGTVTFLDGTRTHRCAHAPVPLLFNSSSLTVSSIQEHYKENTPRGSRLREESWNICARQSRVLERHSWCIFAVLQRASFSSNTEHEIKLASIEEEVSRTWKLCHPCLHISMTTWWGTRWEVYFDERDIQTHGGL